MGSAQSRHPLLPSKKQLTMPLPDLSHIADWGCEAGNWRCEPWTNLKYSVHSKRWSFRSQRQRHLWEHQRDTPTTPLLSMRNSQRRTAGQTMWVIHARKLNKNETLSTGRILVHFTPCEYQSTVPSPWHSHVMDHSRWDVRVVEGEK